MTAFLRTTETENDARSQSQVLSTTLCCLSYLQIFIDHYALLTNERGSYEQLKTVNRMGDYWGSNSEMLFNIKGFSVSVNGR